MNMKIRLKSNMKLGSPFDLGVIELRDEKTTIKALLDEVSKKYSIRFIDPIDNDAITNDYILSINGREYWLMEGGLDTMLHNGDEVRIDIVLLGGG